MKVSISGGFPVENPTKKATVLKGVLLAVSLSEYGSEGFRVRLRRLSEYGSVAYLVERPTGETQAEQYADTVLSYQNMGSYLNEFLRSSFRGSCRNSGTSPHVHFPMKFRHEEGTQTQTFESDNFLVGCGSST